MSLEREEPTATNRGSRDEDETTSDYKYSKLLPGNYSRLDLERKVWAIWSALRRLGFDTDKLNKSLTGKQVVRANNSFNASTIIQVFGLVQILVENQPCTVRGAMYRGIGRLWPDSSEPNYNKCARLILEIRRSGLIPHKWIVDGTRVSDKPSSWSGLSDYAEDVARAYRKDLWERQPDYIEPEGDLFAVRLRIKQPGKTGMFHDWKPWAESIEEAKQIIDKLLQEEPRTEPSEDWYFNENDKIWVLGGSSDHTHFDDEYAFALEIDFNEVEEADIDSDLGSGKYAYGSNHYAGEWNGRAQTLDKAKIKAELAWEEEEERKEYAKSRSR